MKLTDLETTVLKMWINETMDCMGGTNVEEVLDDNMSCIFPSDFATPLKMKLQAIGPVLASLQAKGLCVDHGRPDRFCRGDVYYGENEWFLSEDGVRKAFEIL